MLSVDEVLRVIQAVVMPVAAAPGDLAAGGVLAQDIKIDEDSPPFDRSQLDGFAVRTADAAQGAELPLTGQIDAGGAAFSGVPSPGSCMGINTGGVVPGWADAILMVEHAGRETREGREFIRVIQGVKSGQGIQRRGSDARAGDVVLPAGVRLQAAQRAVCAAAGVKQPLVRAPLVKVLSTGDELLPIDAPVPLPAGMIRNSNQVMLCALVQESGAMLEDLGTCPDDAGRLRQTLEDGLKGDLLIVCGGMSMGTRDLVPGLLKDLGVAMHVEKVRIKPGKPFVLGVLEREGRRRYVAGLPGNPVSSFVTYQRFVREMIRRMEGATEGPRIVRARIDRAMAENGDREFYQPCVLASAPEGMEAQLLAWRGSADMFTLARANGLLIQAAARGHPRPATWETC